MNKVTVPKRVCGYGRVSTKHEEQESSLVTQHEMFTKWIEAHSEEGYQLVNEVYEQKTGTLVTKRPKFQQMIEDAKQGRYDTLLFKDSKRFSRNTEDFLSLVEDLKNNNVNIIFITEGLDTSKENDRTKLSLLGMMAESYSNDLHNNLQRSLRIRYESPNGRLAGNVFGYKRIKGDTSKAEIVPEQADIIRELFNRYAEGEGIASITKDFIERDIRTYQGTKMSMFGVRRFIRNPIYKGVLVMNKRIKTSVRSKRILNDEENWIVRQRPDLKIVEPELWNKCNQRMDMNKQKMDEITDNKIGYKPNILTDKLFSKVVVCGECGRNYNRKESHHRDKDKRYIYLMCGYKKYNKNNQANCTVCTNENVISLDNLKELVRRVIVEILNNSDGLEDLVSKKVASIIKEKKKSSVDKLTDKELTEAMEKLRRYAELYKDGFISSEEYKAMKNTVKNLERAQCANKISSINEKEINKLVKGFLDNLESVIDAGLADDNGVDVKAFNKLFDRIVINNDSIDIIFRAFGEKLGQIDISKVALNSKSRFRVFSPVVDNKKAKCQTPGQIRKREKRREKASRCSDRSVRFMQLDSDVFDGRLTNQVIVGRQKMSINVHIV